MRQREITEINSILRMLWLARQRRVRLTRIKGATINVILSRLTVARRLRGDRGAKDRRRAEGCRVPMCLRSVFFLSFSLSPGFSLSLGNPLFFHSLPLLRAHALPISFSPYFRSSHSPPGYAIRERARKIFASWNAANWPKINTCQRMLPLFSLLLPHYESLCGRRSIDI